MLKDIKYQAKSLHEKYVSADPYPHIVIDNFLPEQIMELVLKEVQNHPDWYWDPTQYVEHYQVNKFFTPAPGVDEFMQSSVDLLKKHCPFTMHVLEYLNSKEILKFLEDLTGIKELVSDPYWLGGGLHQVKNGGKLGIHADFNIHKFLNTHRRINMLIYLNKDWLDEYNGDLEIWRRDMSACVHKIKPIFNRAVIFNITDDAYHGHPIPLNVPENVARYSLALYYYTNDRPEEEKGPYHEVLWKDT
jgi:Rps23 Pro-64 3,4-dihydroxylase Tpa1-like proline 4-hydroxylase